MRWQQGCFGYPRSTSFCSRCRSWLLRFLPSWLLGQQECVFDVRHRDNLLYSQIEERLLLETRAQNVLIDEIIELTGEQTKKKYTKPLRRIAVWNDEHGYVVQLLTNNFKLSASTIAQLYKARWMIEILQKHQAAVENNEFHWYITQCCWDADMDCFVNDATTLLAKAHCKVQMRARQSRRIT